MAINLLKRLESSVNSFSLTLQRIYNLITTTINAINAFEKHGAADLDMYEMTNDDLDIDDSNIDFTIGKKVKIDLADMDYRSWRDDLQKDKDALELLILMIRDITPEHDTKLQTLFELIAKKQKEPINAGNKKMIIFTAFSDTAEYLYENVRVYVKQQFGLDRLDISIKAAYNVGNVIPTPLFQLLSFSVSAVGVFIREFICLFGIADIVEMDTIYVIL